MIYRAPNKKPKFTVTVVTAFKTPSLIVVASDSRTTNSDGSISDDSKKVEAVEFAGRDVVLIAQAGHAQLASRAIEILIRKAGGTPLTDYRTAADLVTESIEELKSDIRRQFKGTSEELQRHFEAYSFELLLAHYFKDKPYIFTVEFELGVVNKRDAKIVSIGCGRLIADYCLNAISPDTMGNWGAIVAAVYAVEEVKKVDPRCGGRVQVGFCINPVEQNDEKHTITRATVINRELIAFASGKLQKQSAGVAARWKKEARKTIMGMNSALTAINNKRRIMPFDA